MYLHIKYMLICSFPSHLIEMVMKREISIKANTEKKVSKTKGIINKHTLYSISLIYFFDFINVTYLTQYFLVNQKA